MSNSLKPDVKCVTKYEWYVNLYWKMPQNWSIHLIFYLIIKCIFKAFMPWISYSMKKQNNIPLLTLIKANVILTLAVVTLCYLLYPVYTFALLATHDCYIILLFNLSIWIYQKLIVTTMVHCGRYRMVFGITTTYAISDYHPLCYEFEFRSHRGIQYNVIKFVSDLRQVGCFLRVLRFPSPIKLTVRILPKYCWKWR
jgi:hypothetical protein